MEANTRHEQDRTLRRTVRAESRAIDSSPMESASETVLLQVTSSEIRYGSILSQRSGSPVVGEVWPLRGRLSRARSKCAGRWRDLLGHVWSRALRIRTEPKRADMHADAHEERGESNDPPSRNPYVVVVDDFFEPTATREHIAKILFEEMNVPRVLFANASVCALLATGSDTGVVVHHGETSGEIVPICHGVVQDFAIRCATFDLHDVRSCLRDADALLVKVSYAIVEAMQACPVDVRAVVARNLVVRGVATQVIPRIGSRLLEKVRDLASRIAGDPSSPVAAGAIAIHARRMSLRSPDDPRSASELTWIGGATLASFRETKWFEANSVSSGSYAMRGNEAVPDPFRLVR